MDEEIKAMERKREFQFLIGKVKMDIIKHKMNKLDSFNSS